MQTLKALDVITDCFSDSELESVDKQIKQGEVAKAAQALSNAGFKDLALRVLGRTKENTLANKLLNEFDLSKNKQALNVSLYIPCFNGKHFLEETIEALKAQSYPFSELILVDDGSTDGSAELAQALGCQVIRHKENRGLSAARNTAIQASRGEIVASVDADVIADRFWLERLIAPFSDPKVVGVSGRVIERYTLTVPDAWRQRMMPMHYFDKHARSIKLFGANMAFRRHELLALGGFNEKYRAAYDDVDISDRILKGGFDTAYVPDALVRHARRDTVNSVIKSAYGWRMPAFENAGVYSDMKTLVSKWILSIKEDIREIQELKRTQRLTVSYPTLLGLFISILIDLSEFEKRGNISGLKALGCELLRRALGQIRSIPEQLRQRIVSEIEKYHGEAGPLDPSVKNFMSVALGELGAVLELGAETYIEIEKSAQSSDTDAEWVYAQARESIFAVPPRVKPANGMRRELAVVADSENLSDLEFIERVSGANPKGIIIGCTAETKTAAIPYALYLKGRLPDAKISFETGNTPYFLSGDLL